MEIYSVLRYYKFLCAWRSFKKKKCQKIRIDLLISVFLGSRISIYDDFNQTSLNFYISFLNTFLSNDCQEKFNTFKGQNIVHFRADFCTFWAKFHTFQGWNTAVSWGVSSWKVLNMSKWNLTLSIAKRPTFLGKITHLSGQDFALLRDKISYLSEAKFCFFLSKILHF